MQPSDLSSGQSTPDSSAEPPPLNLTAFTNPIASTSRLPGGDSAGQAVSFSPGLDPRRPMALTRTATTEITGGFLAGQRYMSTIGGIQMDRRSWSMPRTPSGVVSAFEPSVVPSADAPASLPSQTSLTSAIGMPLAYDSASTSSPVGYAYYAASGAQVGYSHPALADFTSQPRPTRAYSSATYPVATPPPPASTALYESPQARRHSVVGYTDAPASVGHSDVEEAIVKEEKRRRNKESSQRFRDRTRERQREKQERLEFLERRVRDLEGMVRAYRTASQGSSAGPSETDATVMAVLRLQQENESLRSGLRAAEQEIQRLRVGHPTPYQQQSLYTPLPRLSPTESVYGGLSERNSPSPTGAHGPASSQGGSATTPEWPMAGRGPTAYPFSDLREGPHAGPEPAPSSLQLQGLLHPQTAQQQEEQRAAETLSSWTEGESHWGAAADPSSHRQGPI